MKLIWIGIAAALAGCITLSERMQRFQGQPINEITARLGPPQSERRIAGELWYTWNQDFMAPGIGTPVPTHAQCALSIRVDPATNVVQGGRWEGNPVGCGPIERALRQ